MTCLWLLCPLMKSVSWCWDAAPGSAGRLSENTVCRGGFWAPWGREGQWPAGLFPTWAQLQETHTGRSVPLEIGCPSPDGTGWSVGSQMPGIRKNGPTENVSEAHQKSIPKPSSNMCGMASPQQQATQLSSDTGYPETESDSTGTGRSPQAHPHLRCHLCVPPTGWNWRCQLLPPGVRLMW